MQSVKDIIVNALYDVDPSPHDVKKALAVSGVKAEPVDDWLFMDEVYDEIENKIYHAKYLFYAQRNGKQYFVSLTYDALDSYKWSAFVDDDPALLE